MMRKKHAGGTRNLEERTSKKKSTATPRSIRAPRKNQGADLQGVSSASVLHLSPSLLGQRRHSHEHSRSKSLCLRVGELSSDTFPLAEAA